jgi:hypothetical protein
MANEMLLVRPDWLILLASDHPTARLAATELQRTIQRIGGPALSFQSASDGGPAIRLSHGTSGDGFRRWYEDGILEIEGEGPRGLLYGVYDLLEALGCRWVLPGFDGEHLPHHDELELPSEALEQKPSFAGRCLILGHDYYLHDAEEWIIWAARNRFNTIFIHTIDEPMALAAAHLSTWQSVRAKLLPLLEQRSLTLELGGHGLAALVPRQLFKSTPEAFRFDGTKRTPDHNFCPSSPEAQALLRRNARRYFLANPEAEIYHLWADDILGGGWCRCEKCAALSPSDQALLSVNILAQELERLNPSARIAHLAYHDTLAAPSRVEVLPQVVLTYAPRMRSYGHAFGDADSAINREQLDALEANLAYFAPTERPEIGTRVFEYYLDGLLFKAVAPPTASLMREDIRAYKAAGVHTMQALMVNIRPWVFPPLNAYLFGRLLWDCEQSEQAILSDYAKARAPHLPAALLEAYNELGAVWPTFLALQAGESQPRMGIGFKQGPPADMLDYMDAPRPLRERHLEQMSRVIDRLEIGRSAWARVLAGATVTRASLLLEQQEWELNALVISFFYKRQRLYVLEGRGATPEVLRPALAEAQAALNAISAWGESNLDEGFARSNFQLFSTMYQMQLDTIEYRALAGPIRRQLLQYGSLARAVPHIARIRFGRV